MNFLDFQTLPGASARPRGELEFCPLCGWQFHAPEAACGGCVLLGGCSMLKCPNCHYEFVVESKIVRWFEHIFRRRKNDG